MYVRALLTAWSSTRIMRLKLLTRGCIRCWSKVCHWNSKHYRCHLKTFMITSISSSGIFRYVTSITYALGKANATSSYMYSRSGVSTVIFHQTFGPTHLLILFSTAKLSTVLKGSGVYFVSSVLFAPLPVCGQSLAQIN